MRVIGTAGHVDHGKSTLIQALTGTHPDRLKEEREREMTIDLGFAWWTLPNGEEVGVVDVPGHRDFIANMLSGIGSIDAVLLVIAADEGVMPQTREHLDIINLLQIKSGLIALTKTDMVTEADWLELVEQDIRQLLAGTSISDAEIVRVSAKTGDGLKGLQAALQELLSSSSSQADLGRPRLPVDRIFTMPGFGTVVTGTLINGSLQVGDEIQIVPSGVKGRIRGLQTHKRKEESAKPGSRTAVNISGVDVNEIQRGNVVTFPNMYPKTRLIDVRFQYLPNVDKPLKHDSEVKFYSGSAEVIARVRLLGEKTLEPGNEGWLQLELKSEVVVARGDRFILRRPSPSETIGGGEIIDPQPNRLHKRFEPATISKLEDLSRGSPEDVLLQEIGKIGIVKLGEVVESSNLSEDDASSAIRILIEEGRVVLLKGDVKESSADDIVAPMPLWSSLANQAVKLITNYHSEYPLRVGIPKEEVKSKLGISQQGFNFLIKYMSKDSQITEDSPKLLIPGHEIHFSSQQQKSIDDLQSEFDRAPYSPPTIKHCIESLGEDVYLALIELGTLFPVSSEVVFQRKDYKKMVEDVKTIVSTEGSITVAKARDHFGTTRRYVLDFLESLDSEGITQRVGDKRVLKNSNTN